MTDLLGGLLADAVALAALAALLVAAILHLPWRQEAAVAVAATLVVLGTGLVGRDAVEDNVRELLPVVVFLVTILVSRRVRPRRAVRAAARMVGSQTAADRLLLGVFCWRLVTTVLSLDATVVLLTRS